MNKHLSTDKHGNLIINFALFPAITEHLTSSDLNHFNVMNYASETNKNHCKALVKAAKIINELLANRTSESPSVMAKIVHKLDKRALLVTTMFCELFFRNNNEVYYIKKHVEDYLLRYDYF